MANMRMHLALAAAIAGVLVYVYYIHKEIKKLDNHVTSLACCIKTMQAQVLEQKPVSRPVLSQPPLMHPVQDAMESGIDDDLQHDDEDSDSVSSEDIREMMRKIDVLSGKEQAEVDEDDEGDEEGEDDDDDDEEGEDDDDGQDDKEGEDKEGEDKEEVEDDKEGSDDKEGLDDEEGGDDEEDDREDKEEGGDIDTPPERDVPAADALAQTIVCGEGAEDVAEQHAGKQSQHAFVEYKLRAFKIDDLKSILRTTFGMEPPKGTKEVLVKAILDAQEKSQ